MMSQVSLHQRSIEEINVEKTNYDFRKDNRPDDVFASVIKKTTIIEQLWGHIILPKHFNSMGYKVLNVLDTGFDNEGKVSKGIVGSDSDFLFEIKKESKIIRTRIEVKTANTNIKKFLTIKSCSLEGCLRDNAFMFEVNVEWFGIIKPKDIPFYIKTFPAKIHEAFAPEKDSIRLFHDESRNNIPSINELRKQKLLLIKKWSPEAQKVINFLFDRSGRIRNAEYIQIPWRKVEEKYSRLYS